MRPHGSHSDFTALIIAAQGGSVEAARQLVERYQHDALSIAYLFTGSQPAAIDVASRMFELALERLGTFDPEDDFFPWLLRHIPSALALAEVHEQDGPAIGPALADASPTRFQVDDDRSRLRHALDRLAPADRMQLILSDYAGLSEPQAAAIASTGAGDDAPLQSLAEIRRRLRELASIDERQTAANALRRLAVEAPRSALWPEIEQEIEDRFSRRRLRSRLTGVGALAAVLVILGGAGLFLLYGALASDEPSDSGSGALVDSVASATPTAVPRPTATPVPYIPNGDVPDLLLYRIEPASSAWGMADPAAGAGSRLSLPSGDLAGISPDGGTLLLIDEERTSDGVELTLVAASSQNGEERWRADVRPLAEGGPDSVYYDLVVIDDLVFVASHDSSYLENIMTVVVIRLGDGSMRDIWGLDLGIDFSQPGLLVDLYGSLPGQPPALTVHVRNTEQGWQKVHQTALINGVTTFESDPISGLDDPEGARFLAPDGRGLIVIPPHGLADEPAISYLLFDTMTQGKIELPFAPLEEIGGVVVEYLLSHDGQRLFALDIYNRQVAIVDLERRQLERVIDLQGDEVLRETTPMHRPWIPAEELIGNPAVLSPDGRYLYALSPTFDLFDGENYLRGPGIWKVDTSNWTIEAEWPPAEWSSPHSLYIDAAGERLYVYSYVPDTRDFGPVGRLTILTTADGETEASLSPSDMYVTGTLADLYRQHHGHSPSVAGVVPRDNDATPDTPTVDVSVEPVTGEVGTTVTLDVRLLDPATGDVLGDDPPANLRSPSPAAVMAIFSNGEQRRSAILGRSGAGSYSGQMVLDLPGSWSLTLSVGDPTSDGWRVSRPSVARIVDTVPGPDGREYALQVATEPEDIVGGRLTDLTLRFAVAGSDGATPLGDEIIQSLPPALDITLEDGSVATLFRSGFAAYSGFVRFPASGTAFPTVTFTSFDGEPVSVIVRVDVES